MLIMSHHKRVLSGDDLRHIGATKRVHLENEWTIWDEPTVVACADGVWIEFMLLKSLALLVQ